MAIKMQLNILSVENPKLSFRSTVLQLKVPNISTKLNEQNRFLHRTFNWWKLCNELWSFENFQL